MVTGYQWEAEQRAYLLARRRKTYPEIPIGKVQPSLLEKQKSYGPASDLFISADHS